MGKLAGRAEPNPLNRLIHEHPNNTWNLHGTRNLIHYKVQSNYKGFLAEPLSTLLPYNIRITYLGHRQLEAVSGLGRKGLSVIWQRVVHPTSNDIN